MEPGRGGERKAIGESTEGGGEGLWQRLCCGPGAALLSALLLKVLLLLQRRFAANSGWRATEVACSCPLPCRPSPRPRTHGCVRRSSWPGRPRRRAAAGHGAPWRRRVWRPRSRPAPWRPAAWRAHGLPTRLLPTGLCTARAPAARSHGWRWAHGHARPPAAGPHGWWREHGWQHARAPAAGAHGRRRHARPPAARPHGRRHGPGRGRHAAAVWRGPCSPARHGRAAPRVPRRPAAHGRGPARLPAAPAWVPVNVGGARRRCGASWCCGLLGGCSGWLQWNV